MTGMTDQERRAFETLRKTLGLLPDDDLFTVLTIADVRIRRYEGKKI